MDVERRSLAVALASALALIWRPAFGFAVGIGETELVMFIVSTVAFALGVVLASLVLLPRIATRLVPARLREQEALFEAALVGFVLGVVVLALEYVELAVRAFGESPYD